MESMLGFSIAVLIAVIVAKDANNRGMNGIGWGIFTFFMCIVAIPVYLIVRNSK
ncbi:MAG: hypothetical protein KAH77_09715 [Thiomargarita sp.]|nr:hypothetical protein [Thiomargarita sp.]